MTTDRHPLTGGSVCRECGPDVELETEREAFEHLRDAHPQKFEMLDRIVKANTGNSLKSSDLWTPGSPFATILNQSPPGGNRAERRRARGAVHGRRF